MKLLQCKDSSYCIPSEWRCDGEHDCIDASDETDCTNRPAVTTTCSTQVGFMLRVSMHTIQEYQCPGGKCILKIWLCDGDYDCPDRSDEAPLNANCTVPRQLLPGAPTTTTTIDPIRGVKCQSDEWQCASKTHCVHKSFLCDGVEQCADGSDEGTKLCLTPTGKSSRISV